MHFQVLRSCGLRHSVTDILSVFIVAIPFGKIADQVGRKTVFILSIVGLIAGTTWILVVGMCAKFDLDMV